MATLSEQPEQQPAHAWLKGFCPTPMETTLRDVISQKHPGTNQWFLRDNKIASWLKGDTGAAWIIPSQDTPAPGIRKLWLYGPYGCGKTILAGSFIEQLMHGRTSQHAVCYFFCSRLKLDTIRPVNIMKTLLSQLAQQHEQVAEILRRCIEDGALPNGLHVDGATQFDHHDLTHLVKLLEFLSGLFDRVSIVINAIDQLNMDKEEQLVCLLSPIIDKPTSSIRGLFTTADTPDQQRLCMGSHSCPIFVKGQSEDIRLVVRHLIHEKIQKGEVHLQPRVVQQGLEEHLVGQSHGAWLWAVCELENQCGLIRKGLWRPSPIPPTSTAATPYGMYGPDKNDWRIAMFPYGPQLERILKEGTPRSNFILTRVLRWVYASTQMSDAQLTMDETRDALALLLNHHKLTDAALETEVQDNEILEICGPLIRKSIDGDGLEFRHHTVEGYLHRFMTENNPDLQKFQVTAMTCGEAVDDFVLLCTLLEEQKWTMKAEAMYQKVLRIRERFWGPDHNLTLATMNNLATFFEDQGRSNEAEPLYLKALQSYEKAEEPDRASMLNTINNIGVLYKKQGRYDEAEAMYKRVIEGRETLFGLQHDSTLLAMNNLAFLYVQRGQRQEAREIWERMLPAYEEIAGPDDIKTLKTVFNLGVICKMDNKMYEAVEYFERALEGYEYLFSPDHPLVIDAADHLTQAYVKDEFKAEAADGLFDRVLKAREKTLGPDHPSVISILENYSRVKDVLGYDEDAEAMLKRVFESRMQTLGPDHALTLEACVSVGGFLEHHGQVRDSIEWHQRACQGYERTLGPDHEKTIEVMEALGESLRDNNQLDEGIAVYDKIVKSKERTLGPEHFNTLTALDKAASMRENKGLDDEAITIWKRVREAHERRAGPEDTYARLAAHQIGMVYRKQGRIEEAEKLLLELIEIFERSIGTKFYVQAVGRDLIEIYNSQARFTEAQMIQRRVDRMAPTQY